MVRLTWPGRNHAAPPGAPAAHGPPTDASGWANRLLHGDNLEAKERLAADPAVRGAVNLVYMDPPFNTGGAFYIGGKSGGRTATETMAYSDDRPLPEHLSFMEARLRALAPLLAPNASVFLHADARTIHYLRVLMDEVFGPESFVNEIIWHYRSGGAARRRYASKHDTILWYATGPRPTFHPRAVATPVTRRNHMKRVITPEGRAARAIRSNGKTYIYPDDAHATPTDVWTDISHLHQRDPERTGYATQKPEALLTRIIAGSSDPGDLVLDPFCGSGTTLAAAGALDRRWIGVDASEAAIAICERRLATTTLSHSDTTRA